ncbi:MAG: hypothetical protein DMG33_16470 [Acidobacteria bacterium]|nr:MAG: hypothetical protein DMG33_16470 [Acidobacteriota bacterium]
MAHAAKKNPQASRPELQHQIALRTRAAENAEGLLHVFSDVWVAETLRYGNWVLATPPSKEGGYSKKSLPFE